MAPPISTHKVAVIGGDGIGPEVTAEALKVVPRGRRTATETVDFDLGGRATCVPARCCPIPRSKSWQAFDAIMLGAVGTPDVPPGVLERGLLLRLRFTLDLYVNLRPFRAGAKHAEQRRRLSRWCRENTEGILRG